MQPATDTPLAGVSLFNGFLGGFACVGSDQRLYQASRDGGNPWTITDVISFWQSTAGITLPFPRPGAGARADGAIAMFAAQALPTEIGVPNYIYLCYIARNGHVLALPYPLEVSTADLPKGATIASAWNPDLTERTGAPPARPDSGVACYGWRSEDSYHVVYTGTDENVWELYWVPGSNDDVNGGLLWQANNLSARTGYTDVLAPRKGSPLAATMFQRENSEHVVYIAGDNTIRELYFYNGSWGGNNLTEAASAHAPAANSPLTTFASEYEDTLHVCYLGTDGAVHELWWDQGGWNPDHTISNYGLAPASDTDITGYACEYDQTHHVVYTDVNDNIIELYRSGNEWDYSLLVPGDGHSAPLPPLSTATPLSGYSTDWNKSEHVIYLDNQGRVQELYRANNRWNTGETIS